MKEHHYTLQVNWTGNKGAGTESYKGYERNFEICIDGKPTLAGSSDPAFNGDRSKYNPEELLLAAISSCHMLWYLHFCADEGVIVTEYDDNATGLMTENYNGSGKFENVMLHPTVKVLDESMVEKAIVLHNKAHEYCFIANSVNFAISHKPVILLNK